MSTTYLFKTERGRVLIADIRSSIGYSYPEVLIENLRKQSYSLADIATRDVFNIEKEEFNNYLIENVMEVQDIQAVCLDLQLSTEYVIRICASTWAVPIQEGFKLLNYDRFRTVTKTDDRMLDELKEESWKTGKSLDEIFDTYVKYVTPSTAPIYDRRRLCEAWIGLQNKNETGMKYDSSSKKIYNDNIDHHGITEVMARQHNIDYYDEEACAKLSQELFGVV